MKALKTRLKTDTFLKHNLVLFTGSLVAAGFNYLYYPVLARLMEPADFGGVQLLLSLFLQASVLMTVATIVIVNLVANRASRPKDYAALGELEWLLTLIALGIAVATILFAGQLQQFFQMESAAPFMALALAFLVSIPVVFRVAFLRGRQRFGQASVGQVLTASGRLLFAALLVLAGLQTFGAIAGLVLAQLIALWYVARRARQAGRTQPLALKRLPRLRRIRPQLKYAGFVALITLLVMVQFSVDMLIVKHYFSPETAGLYAGIATVARIIYFLTASVAAVLLSSVLLADTSGRNRRLLIRSGGYTAALGGATLALFALAPELVVKLLVGAEYAEVATLLPPLGLALFIVSLTNLLLMYAMGLRLYRVLVPAVAGAAITYALLIANHATLEQVVSSILIGSLSLFALVGGWALLQIIPKKRATA